MSRVLVLCYHAVSSSWRSKLAVPERLLAQHVGYLRRHAWAGMTLTQVERARRARALPPRTVVFTFDDAYASVLRAVPILAGAGYPGTVFPVTGFVDSGEPFHWPGLARYLPEDPREILSLSWGELERLKDGGWEIGSHTEGHRLLTAADDVGLDRELRDSRRAIMSRLGVCDAVAYPYGHADARVAAAAAAAGYVAGCTLLRAQEFDEPLRRPRINMGPSDTAARARIKIATSSSPLRRSRFLARRERPDNGSVLRQQATSPARIVSSG